MTRFCLFRFWLMLVVLVVICGSVSASPDHYWGNNAANCGSCHKAVVEKWSQTRHSMAYDSLKMIPSFGYSCQSCHNTGWNTNLLNFGADEYLTAGENNAYIFTDETNFKRVSNIQCENCHGPLGKEDRTFLGFSEHKDAAVTEYSAESCGTCHQGSHHPTYTDWQMSKHAVSKATSIPGGAFSFIASNNNCAACHTAEGFAQFVGQPDLVPNVVAPGEAGHDLTCAACHDPHSHEKGGQLRMAKEEICSKCHNPEFSPEAAPEPNGDEVHHSTAFMFEGKGGYQYEGAIYKSSAHKFAIEDKCVTCHVYTKPFQGGTPEVPAYTGHSFTPQGESCVTCHADFNPAAGNFDFRGVQSKVKALADSLHSLLSMATKEDSTSAAFYRAKFNLEFVESDGSWGVHNTKYAKALLESALVNFKPSTSAVTKNGLPVVFQLRQNYPNPFNPTTTIAFSTPQHAEVRLVVYNLLGGRVRTLADDLRSAGEYQIVWNGLDDFGQAAGSGTYIYRLECGDQVQTRKMVFLR